MPTRRTLTRPALLVAGASLALALAAPTALARDRDVRIIDFAFSPRTVTITAGDSVTWVNRDSVEHTATARNGAFDTGLLAQGQRATIRFTQAGRYRYLCTPHPNMVGTVVVRRAASAGSGGARPPDTSTVAALSDAGAARDDAASALAWLLAAAGAGLVVTERRLRHRWAGRPAGAAD